MVDTCEHVKMAAYARITHKNVIFKMGMIERIGRRSVYNKNYRERRILYTTREKEINNSSMYLIKLSIIENFIWAMM